MTFTLLLSSLALLSPQGFPTAPPVDPSLQGEIRMEFIESGPSAAEIDAYVEKLHHHPLLRKSLRGTNFRILSFRMQALPAKPGLPSVYTTKFEAIGFNYTDNAAFRIHGDAKDWGSIQFEAHDLQPIPSEEEFQAAVEILKGDPQIGPLIQQGFVQPYRPMPPLLPAPWIDSSAERTLGVGLLPLNGSGARHEIVGVIMSNQNILHFAGGAPPTSGAGRSACNPPPSGGSSGYGNGELSINIIVRNQTIWSFRIVRPGASSGQDGSGIEVLDVYYKGKKVLAHGHVPVLNVLYDNNVCGPYRDWQDQEHDFDATGRHIRSGFRLAYTPAQTLMEDGTDSGNFRGVAIYREGMEVVLKSEIAAGWYRYMPEWRFHINGTIQALFGYDAVQNSCTCRRHHHHAYWRLDFDIGTGASNNIQQYDHSATPRYSTLATEVKKYRDAPTWRHWLISDSQTGDSYALVPGDFVGRDDGIADNYARGDAWFLKYQPGQIDDGSGWGSEIRVDNYVNGESLVDEDIVIWYGAHFTHEDPYGMTMRHGPSLIPVSW